ncbi:MAG: DUF429 domain-containing protein [Candidatus Micrarchaeota archaeon]|nr:DUF429 domain-containing protein [Candidatus Micrarchaeota archaeon]
MIFIGLDLAWSQKNNSGLAVIEGDRKQGKLVSAGLALSDEEILDSVSKATGMNPALIAIDAPLVVPNKTGRREAERIVGDLFRKYDAGAHPSNRERLGAWSGGKIRGEEIVKSLEGIGFAHDPVLGGYEEARKIFEVYPHPSMVVLFGLDRILRYKAKPNRDPGFRIGEFERYERLLEGLNGASPSLRIGKKFLLGKKMEHLGGAELKRHEDTLDAVFCAYLAYYYWANPQKCAILGSLKEGYIMTPVFNHMKGKQSSLL